jgi:predicted short-subunit dehydrogenase-like oxidoreductase (DUF2520 family)
MDVAVVGAGRVGTAFAVLLERAGHRIVALSGRARTRVRAARYLPSIPLVDPADASSRAGLVLITTPDDAIASVCAQIAAAGGFRTEQVVAHTSGAVGLEALDPARDAGARRLCLHPLQTFPDVESALRSLSGATVAVTADDEPTVGLGERLAVDLGARPIRLTADVKVLYHAAAVFASNYLVAVTAIAESLLVRVGVDDPLERLLPLSRASLENVASLGADRALTGPAVRGDAGTVEGNLRALATDAPEAVAPYIALARVALDIGERSGRLEPDGRSAVEEVLDRWT